MSLPKLISTSQTTKARLLHYFPPSPDAVPAEDEAIDSYCGMHLDHSLLTGLCSVSFPIHRFSEQSTYMHRQAMYLAEDPTTGEVTVTSSPSPDSGLYIRTRGGDLTKVTIPSDCLAFQTGEALEVATGKKLRATPHCVRVGQVPSTPNGPKISRETFALFMQPNVNEQLSPTQNFGQFSKAVFSEHYEGATM